MAPTSARIVLDLDGTLLDARLRQVGVAAEALQSIGAGALDTARFWRAKRAGATTREALLRLGYSSGVAAEAAARWAQRIEADDWLERDRALPGAGRALRRLRAAGIPVIVLTARRRAPGAELSLRSAGLESLVDELLVVDPLKASAAKAEILRSRDAGAFVGDTESDGAAAAAAGVRFVAVSTGQRSAGYLRARVPEVVRSLGVALDLASRSPERASAASAR